MASLKISAVLLLLLLKRHTAHQKVGRAGLCGRLEQPRPVVQKQMAGSAYLSSHYVAVKILATAPHNRSSSSQALEHSANTMRSRGLRLEDALCTDCTETSTLVPAWAWA